MAITKLGVIKTTLIDYPGEVAATLFTPGCNFRCGYCHNPGLVTPPFSGDLVSITEVKQFLQKRSNVLGGVCITGGEPLMHEDLPDLVRYIHSIGLKVKIDTNGSYPDRLQRLNADYIAMDLKTAFGSYHKLLPKTGAKQEKQNIPDNIQKSLHWIKQSGIPHEFRTTLVPGIVSFQEIRELASYLTKDDKWIITQFSPIHCLNPEFETVPPYPVKEVESLIRELTEQGLSVRLRSLSILQQ
ncbi:MAG: anaerobic ribonucleoside-triphosphate reductase activating protein [Spirochaetia bacterium]